MKAEGHVSALFEVWNLMGGGVGGTLFTCFLLIVGAGGVTWFLFLLVDIFDEEQEQLLEQERAAIPPPPELPSDRITEEQREELNAMMLRDRGWREAPEQPGKFLYVCDDFVASLSLELVEKAIIYSITCEVRPTAAPPESLLLVIKDANRVFPSTISPWRSEAKANHNGVFIHDDLRFEGDMKVLVDSIVDTTRLFASAEDRLEVSTFSLREGVYSMEFMLLADVAHNMYPPHKRELSMMRLGRYADLLSSAGAAFGWAGKSKRDLLGELLANPEAGWSIRRDASARYLRCLDEDEKIPWLVEQIKAPERDIVEAGFLLSLLHGLEPDERVLGPLIDAALEQPRLLQWILMNSKELITARLLGPNKERWFSAIFANDGGLTEEHMREVIAHLDPNILLSRELDGKARGVLLANMLGMHDEGHFEDIVHTLLRELDDADLVVILETLSLHHNPGIARAAASLASNPAQIDTTREFQALLWILESQLQDHAEILRQPGVERFLCQCLEHPDGRIASMAPPLIIELGGPLSLSLLSELLARPGVASSPSVIGKTIQGIRLRMGSDLDGFVGGLSVAQGSGGELTVVAEGGSISMTE